MWRIGLLGLSVLLTGPALAEDCPATYIDFGRLPHVAEALANSGEITIVAFGSSSTQGWMSSDAAHAYPTILQKALEAAFPAAHIAVLNRGIGGQDAAEELPRIDSDVTALRPSLVVWQVGANGALRSVDPNVFRRFVTLGTERMLAAGMDVVLMDNQRAPLILASPEHIKIDQIVDEVAQDLHVGMFHRGALMAEWEAAGYAPAQFVSSDGLHHNDHGYRCVALAVAEGIIRGVGPTSAPVRTSSTLPPVVSRQPAR